MTDSEMTTYGAPSDPGEDLERLIRSALDDEGPLMFKDLTLKIRSSFTISPATVHDCLNNLLAAGRLAVSPSGVYYKP